MLDGVVVAVSGDVQDRAARVHMLDIGATVGEYQIERLVGEGGMGQVYGAIHPVIGKRAAIKVLRGELCSNAEAVDRFVLEARAVNQIGHPNIVDVFAFGSLPDGRQYMVMEWLRGESLDQRIRRTPPTIDEACEITIGICAALDAAHAENIIHRDLKPHNVFLVHARGMKPQVKLLDFGLVKLVGEEGMERTRSGSMLGTPAYMSPEQARGRGVDHRTDLYALGVMLFELATGSLPFVEPSAMEMVMAHMQTPPPIPSTFKPAIPPILDELIIGLLAKEPDQRPTLAYTVNVLAEVRRLAETTPVRRTGPAAATLMAAAAPHVVSSAALTAASAMPMPADAGASVPVFAMASAPASQGLGSVNAPATQIEPASTGKRRVALAVIGVLAAGAIAFGVVLALRGSTPAGATPDAAPVATPIITPDAAPVATIDAAPAIVDAAIAPVVDAAQIVEPDAGRGRPRPPTRSDAGVIRTAPADAASIPIPDASATKPFDDGDGLLPTKPGGSR